MRRNGRIGEFVSVYLNEVQKAVYVASDGGRVCRPLLIVERGGGHHVSDECCIESRYVIPSLTSSFVACINQYTYSDYVDIYLQEGFYSLRSISIALAAR